MGELFSGLPGTAAAVGNVRGGEGRRAGEEEVRKNGSLKKEKEKICRKYVKNL